MRAYRVISADSHVIEPPDLWLKYIDPKFRDRAPRIISEPDTDVLMIEGLPKRPVGSAAGAGKPKSEIRMKGKFAEVRPGAYEPGARVQDMEQDGLDAEVVYPTLALSLYAVPHVSFMYACMEAYNTWLVDFCKGAPDRLRGPAMISLEDMDRGIAELQRTKKLGLSGGMIGIDPGDPAGYSERKYDRFWAVAQDLDAPIGMHVLTERDRAKASFTLVEDQSGAMVLRQFAADFVATIQRSLQSMILSGVFDRFPRLKIVAVETGASWAVPFLEIVDQMARGEFSLNMEHSLKGNMLPSDYFHRNVFCTFIRDRNGVQCRNIVGVENMMWSSDFPHAISTWPNSSRVLEEHFAGVPQRDREKMVAGNARRLYGFGL